MKTKKVLYRIFFVLLLLFVLSFNSCKNKKKCYRCGEQNMNIFYYDRVCDESELNYHLSHGDICYGW